MISISYVVGTHNEGANYLEPLLSQLVKFKDPEDEIIVVDDYSANEETLNVLDKYSDRIKVFKHSLNGDFSEHKNFMGSVATKDFIFNIDADEMPHENLLKAVKEILLNNPGVELYYVPRINLVPDLPEEYVSAYGWRKDDKGWINFPDYQGRIYKRAAHIKWKNKVHEVIEGHSMHSMLPAVDEEGQPYSDYCLLHIKTAARQISQNELYSKIS